MFVAATSDGRVLVADMDNHRIQLFGSSYPAAWRGEYHDNRYLVKPPVLAREEAVVDFYWGDGSPDGTLPTDGFSARWRRTVYLSAGTYRFLLAVDDGARLWVDGRRIIDVWRDQEMAEHTASVTLSEGYHHLLLEYYENTGGAAVQLGWAATATRTPPPTSEVGHVYLSLLMKPAPTPTPTPEPACREPANNFAAGACGPLVAGVVYRDYIASEEDSGDWVYFDLAQSQRIEIWLRELCNTCDFDLYLFRDPPDAAHQIGYSGVVGRGAEEHIIAAGPGGGRYYIWVRRVEGWSTTQPYCGVN